MKLKREKLQVIHDILKAVQEKNGTIKPTHIMYKANLSHQMLDDYLHDLLDKGFLLEMAKAKGKTYSLTEKGFEFLNSYSMITEFMKRFGLD